MKYIYCEDSGSGFYFWQLINIYIFNKKYIVEKSDGIADLVNKVKRVMNTDDEYLIAFDNCVDNKEIAPYILELRSIQNDCRNIFLVDYICFEQLVLACSKIEEVFPKLKNNKSLEIIREHIKEDYRDCTNLRKMARIDKKITTEKWFRPILENACINSKDNITLDNGKRYIKQTMEHHFIKKGEWSQCWYTDCTKNCPDTYCWKSTNNCEGCSINMKNSSCKNSETFNHRLRKYNEVSNCERKLPNKLSERIKFIFLNKILKQMLGYE